MVPKFHKSWLEKNSISAKTSFVFKIAEKFAKHSKKCIYIIEAVPRFHKSVNEKIIIA